MEKPFRVGLNYLAIIEVAKIYNFKLTQREFEIIREIERFIMERDNGK